METLSATSPRPNNTTTASTGPYEDYSEDPTISQSVIKIEIFPDGGYKKHQSALARSLAQVSMPCTYDDFEQVLLKLTWLCKTRYDLLAPVTKLHEVRRSNFSRNDIHTLNKATRQANTHYGRGLVSHRLDRDSFQLVVFTSASPVDRDLVSNMSFVVFLVDQTAKANWLRCASFQTKMTKPSLLYAQLYIFLVAFDFAVPLRDELGKLINACVPLYILSDSKPITEILDFYQHNRTGESLPTHELVEDDLVMDFKAIHDACRREEIHDVAYVAPSQNIAGCFLRHNDKCIALEILLDTGCLELSVDRWTIRVGVQHIEEDMQENENGTEIDVGSKIASEAEDNADEQVKEEIDVDFGEQGDNETQENAYAAGTDIAYEDIVQDENHDKDVTKDEDKAVQIEESIIEQPESILTQESNAVVPGNIYTDKQSERNHLNDVSNHNGPNSEQNGVEQTSNSSTVLLRESETVELHVAQGLEAASTRHVNSDGSEHDDEGRRYVDAVEGLPEEDGGHQLSSYKTNVGSPDVRIQNTDDKTENRCGVAQAAKKSISEVHHETIDNTETYETNSTPSNSNLPVSNNRGEQPNGNRNENDSAKADIDGTENDGKLMNSAVKEVA